MNQDQLNKVTQLKDIILTARAAKQYADSINTALSARLKQLSDALNALVGSDDTTQAIDTFNEILAFLDGISGTTLDALLSNIRDTMDTLSRTKQDVISDLEQIRSGAAAGADAYQKPQSGIPKTDLAEGVQTSLNKADTAYQKPGGGVPSSDLAGNIPSAKLAAAVQALLAAAGTALQPDDLNTLNSKVSALESLIKADSGATINKFNEIVAFLAGISQYDTLEGLLADLSTQISAKYSKPAKGIPTKDLSAAVQASLLRADNSYQKPGTGIPKSDMDDNVQESLHKADTAYQKPKSGIPEQDLTLVIQNLLALAGTAYQKPGTGIPKNDLSTVVKNLLNKADTAYQQPQDGIPATDLTAGVQALLIAAQTALQPADLNTLNSKVAALEALVSEDSDPTAAIDKFNEIVAFLASIENTDTLAGILSNINDAIAAKYTKPQDGIPASDLSEEAQGALEAGSTALQFIPGTDPLGTEMADEYARVLGQLYQALYDAQAVTDAANEAITQTGLAKAAALAAADTANNAASNANGKAQQAQQAAENAARIMDSAKGDYEDLNERLGHIDDEVEQRLALIPNDDPSSLWNDDSSDDGSSDDDSSEY